VPSKNTIPAERSILEYPSVDALASYGSTAAGQASGIFPTYMQGMAQHPRTQQPRMQQQVANPKQEQAPQKPSYYAQTVDRNGIVRWGMSSSAPDPDEEAARSHEGSSGSGYNPSNVKYGISEQYQQGRGQQPNKTSSPQDYKPQSLSEYANYNTPQYDPPMSQFGGPTYAPINHPSLGPHQHSPMPSEQARYQRPALESTPQPPPPPPPPPIAIPNILEAGKSYIRCVQYHIQHGQVQSFIQEMACFIQGSPIQGLTGYDVIFDKNYDALMVVQRFCSENDYCRFRDQTAQYLERVLQPLLADNAPQGTEMRGLFLSTSC